MYIIKRFNEFGSGARYLTSMLLGMLASFALPPFFVFPFLIVAFSGFYLLLEGCVNKKSAFFTGWWFGFGHFVVGLYWISFSLLVDPEKFAWLIPFAVSLIPAALGVYIGLLSIFFIKIPLSGWRKILMFSCLWVATEILRSHLFTGFPWNLIGYSFSFSDALIQPASVFGVYGLSLLVILLATMPVLLLTQSVKISKKPVLTIYLFFLFTFFWGVINLQNEVSGEKLNVRIVQPNIPQELKWAPEKTFKNFTDIIDISGTVTDFKPDIVVWPESAVPFLLEEEPEMRQVIAESLPKNSFLITGAIRADRETADFWNSVLVINDSGNIIAYYDKHHLVPFGEFVPFRTLFPFINKITPGDTDFSRGPGPSTIKIENVPAFSPTICYEGIFSSYVKDRNNPPRFLLNVTNDGWFGKSTGPYQHFQMTRMRAAEEGMPVIRAANTGISGVFDAKGRVVNSLGLGKTGWLDVTFNLPKEGSMVNIYSIFGETLPIILIISLGFFCYFTEKRSLK